MFCWGIIDGIQHLAFHKYFFQANEAQNQLRTKLSSEPVIGSWQKVVHIRQMYPSFDMHRNR